ncbi:purine-nucleoside phosphorylase [Halobacterium sp. R2-5]|uniref:purine-nucleoside phosphorylase n=1 Tax=Halobacterium sp. R2-5 TaxID=2715751 RepID=UPI00141F5C99|nr:purine-nucleoside phosphorylase [Halobacterium sp. R2-5]NIC00359.1 purine-nucleoside phosphorylase [Halobacterium sp. R2-5]
MTDAANGHGEVAEAVLRVLHQAGVAVTADVVATNLAAALDDEPTTAEVADELAALAEDDLVRLFADTDEYYVITDRGSAHVSTELDEEGFGFVG